MALHWLVTLLIFGLFPLGLYMSDLPLSVLKLELYAWHKWFGITVLLLVVLRLGWRACHRPPKLPTSTVDFSATQMGVAMHGHFKALVAVVDFQPAGLAKSHVNVAINAASVDAGSSQTDDLLTGSGWLDAKTYPRTASFPPASPRPAPGSMGSRGSAPSRAKPSRCACS
ncbi:hypothetical protein THIX_10537 [Thiomonas sp. X19]|nr:hypothetical protein THIX_10537 [Thiomonas sp. X19]